MYGNEFSMGFGLVGLEGFGLVGLEGRNIRDGRTGLTYYLIFFLFFFCICDEGVFSYGMY